MASRAATCTFASAGTNGWEDASNWTCGHTPASMDDVVIPSSTSTHLTADASTNTITVEANALLVFEGAGGVHYNVSTSGGDITNHGMIQIQENADITMSTRNGALYTTTTNDGILSVSSTTAFEMGDFRNAGTLLIDPASGSHDGGPNIRLEGLWDNTGGSVTLLGCPSIRTCQSGASLHILSSDMHIPGGISFPIVRILASLGGNTFLDGDIETNEFHTGNSTVFAGSYTIHTNQFQRDGTGTFDAGTGVIDFWGTPAPPGVGVTGNIAFLVANTGTLDPFNLLRLNDAGTALIFASDATATNVEVSAGTLAFNVDGMPQPSTLTITGAGTGLSRPLRFLGGSASTIDASTGTVRYAANSGSVDVDPAVYPSLVFTGDAQYNLTASTTALGSTSLFSGATLAAGAQQLHALGAILNTGLVTYSIGGGVIHAVDAVQFTDGHGTPVSAIALGDSVYITIQDQSRNVDGALVETITVPVTTNVAAGNDTEILTLTETSASSSIFRNLAPLTVRAATVGASNGFFDLQGDGSIAATYTDTQDLTDVRTTTITITCGTTCAPSTPSGGGGGGAGALTAQSSSLPPSTWSFTTSTTPHASPTSSLTTNATSTFNRPITSSSPTVIAPLPATTASDASTPSPARASLGASGPCHVLALLDTSVARGCKGASEDARTFGVLLTEDDRDAIGLFISRGTSQATYQLGERERRSLVRDYFDTQRRGSIDWNDMDRLASGNIPLTRNLLVEARTKTSAQAAFRRVVGHAPLLSRSTDRLYWNMLFFRVRARPRIIEDERFGLSGFQKVFRRNPVSPLDWAATRVAARVRLAKEPRRK